MIDVRIAQGLMSADEFVSFLNGGASSAAFSEWSWAVVPIAFLGGLAMNLTPCVLPMVPINMMIIGASAKRGAAYGLGIAFAYGLLGVAASVGGLAFGTIQGNPWFNAAVAVVFVALALSLWDVFFIDLSHFRPTPRQSQTGMLQAFTPFFLGMLSAVLAGACVAPVLISVLLLTADLVAKGRWMAVALPFVVGLGMGLPWPFVGAGLKVLPRPGRWMKQVNRLFGLIVLCFAAWYGHLAWQGFSSNLQPPTTNHQPQTTNLQPSTFASALATAKRPVLVDCWATWCKNCKHMDAVLEDEKVRAALRPYTVIRLQAEDMDELLSLKGFETIKGLPAFVIITDSAPAP